MERRLAVILAADVVDYSRLMGADEAATLAALNQLRSEVFQPTLSDHFGTVIKRMGDGWFVEFANVANSVVCAMAIQDAVARHEMIRLRMGVHIGDVTFQEDDIYGDGINVAARLEALAEPGQVLISDLVHHSLDVKTASQFTGGAAVELKNINRPVQVWCWPETTAAQAMDADVAQPASLPLPDKPSIAVLPFDNMSGDPEQEYFSDGIAEDVITALARFSSLFVIARNSSFTYKGSAVDISVVGRELGVRYVVEGSVRKSGNRVRITAQLIDAMTGRHLWADRFDGNLDDVFELQDRITEHIVVAVEPEISLHERAQARRKPPESLDAWTLVQRGLAHHYRVTKFDRGEAIRLFEEAVAMDPEFAIAHAYLANALRPANAMSMGHIENLAEAETSARLAAERAISLDPKEPIAHYALGRLHMYAGEVQSAIAEMQTAVAVNPNFAWGHYGLALAYFYGGGQAKEALPHHDAALRLSPRDPMHWTILLNKGAALRFLGRYQEAIEICRLACQYPDAGIMPFLILAGALAEAGLEDEAKKVLVRARRLEPNLSIRFFDGKLPGMHDSVMTSMLESFRKAGLHE